MTASTPNRDDAPLVGFSRLAMERGTALIGKLPAPPCLPSPLASTHRDLPASLPMPSLAPRAQKYWKRETRETTSPSLMEFVSHMSLDEVAQSFSTRRDAPASSAALDLLEEDGATSNQEPNGETQSSSWSSLPPAPPLGPTSTQWSLTTPETMKTTIAAPQALRLSLQKRKSPMVHATPVNGNAPLMLPTLTENSRVPSTSGSTPKNESGQHALLNLQPGTRSTKKTKHYKKLVQSAPMLPSSPDLEDRDLTTVSRRYHTPYFSPPAGSVTLVNPNFRRIPSAVASPAPQQQQRRVMAPPPAALPSLDEAVERSAPPKWLRMKKRTSLLSALRMGATESS